MPEAKPQPKPQGVPIEQFLKPLGDAMERNEASQQERHKEMAGLLIRIASALESLTGGQGSLEEVTVALEVAVAKKPFQRILDVIKTGFSVSQEEIDAALAAKKL